MQSYNYYRVIITDLNAPSYRSFVSHPMDLGTIEESIREGLYVKTIIIRSHSGSNSDYDNDDEATRTTAQQHYILPGLQSFVRLVWSNCLLFISTIAIVIITAT